MIGMTAVVDALRARAQASRREVAAIEEQLSGARERRQTIIVEMRDVGLSWAMIAGDIGLSPSHCSTIVAEAPEPVTIE